MEDRDVVQWLCEELSAGGARDRDMGELEALVDRRTLEIRRQVLQRLVQDEADRTEFGCPVCGEKLSMVHRGRQRTVASTVGPVSFARDYGHCGRCESHAAPADAALGLHGRASASPRLQEICALTVLHGPAGRAAEDVRRLAGVEVCASTLHREGFRQGERALELRERDIRRAETPEGAALLAAEARAAPRDATLIIEIDAWNIRERDNWGLTEAVREAGGDTGRWHWVYTGTVFRLDQSGTTQSGRAVVTDRGYVATRAGIEAFERQMHVEALRRGLLQAETVLVLGDGAVWIWNLAARRFARASQRIDLFHVKQHLWELAASLHGKGTAEAQLWIRPYLCWLERRKNGALDIIESLEQLQLRTDADGAEAIARELGYFREHCGRMDYKAAKAEGQPCGSGAIESTCSQYQRRFKLTGQFWSLEGDEAFLALATLHRNGRWHQLFPHNLN